MPLSDASVPFTKLIEDCRLLLGSEVQIADDSASAVTKPLLSLLDQCRSITREVEADSEPIRTIHHFACTGGTLISKCLASTPNVQLLSEVAPFSLMKPALGSKFTPTDLIRLLRESSRGSSTRLEFDVFLSGIDVIQEQCVKTGIRLVIREHSHSSYCYGKSILDVPSVAELLAERHPVRSLVTVRHPLDSFLSLVRQGWLNFEPDSLDEYANRYLKFLSDHAGQTVIRYEDFVHEPEKTMQSICLALDLPYSEGFIDTFSAQSLSGDSGRSSAKIATRDRRPVPDDVASQLDSEHFSELCCRLGYDSQLKRVREQPGKDGNGT